MDEGKDNTSEGNAIVTEKVKQRYLQTIQYLIYESQVKWFLMMIIYVLIGIFMIGYQVLYREKKIWCVFFSHLLLCVCW